MSSYQCDLKKQKSVRTKPRGVVDTHVKTHVNVHGHRLSIECISLLKLLMGNSPTLLRRLYYIMEMEFSDASRGVSMESLTVHSGGTSVHLQLEVLHPEVGKNGCLHCEQPFGRARALQLSHSRPEGTPQMSSSIILPLSFSNFLWMSSCLIASWPSR